MKRIAFLAAGLVALTTAPAAMACALPAPMPYIRETPPERIGDGEILAEVELDMDAPMSIQSRGIPFRVRRLIQGEPAISLVALPSDCFSPPPGRWSGFMVARPVSREGDIVFVQPLSPSRAPGFGVSRTRPSAQ